MAAFFRWGAYVGDMAGKVRTFGDRMLFIECVFPGPGFSGIDVLLTLGLAEDTP